MKAFYRVRRLSACAFLFAGTLPAAELLHFDFNDSAHLGAQAGGLFEGEVHGAVAPAKTPGAADFSGGYVKIPFFPGPQGPFTIEARFMLRKYGPEDSRFIEDILNTATWDNGPSQGFDFRVGAAYLYPVLPREGYRTEAEWQAAQGDWSFIDRGRMSVCFANFVMARRDDDRNWKQAMTDRCIDLNAWTHLAAVWDGKDMRIYLDGLDATDTLRLDGVGAPTRIDSVETAYVGKRYDGAFDPRDFDGEIDYVKMEDKALTAAEIRQRYRETFVPADRDALCKGVLVPAYPQAGQICKGKIPFEVRVTGHAGCSDPAFVAAFLSGDSVEIELSKDPHFGDVAVRLTVSATAFELKDADLAPLAGYNGAIFWRARLKAKAAPQKAAAKASAADLPEWSAGRPLLLDLRPSALRSALRFVIAGKGLFLPDRGAAPALYDLRGQRVPARFERVEGGWRLAEAPAGSGAFLAR